MIICQRVLQLVALSVFSISCASTQGVGHKKSSEDYTKGTYSVGLQSSKINSKSCSRSKKLWPTKSWKELVPLANACAKSKKYSQLAKLGQHMAEVRPQSPWGAYYMSVAASETGQSQLALWMVELALKKTPKLGLLHYQKGRVLWKDGSNSVAVTAMNRALELDRNLVQAHLFLGQVYFRDHAFSRAGKHLQAVLKVDSDNSIALGHLGLIRKEQGEGKEAIELLKSATRYDSSNVGLRLALAESYESLESNYSMALKEYKTARIKTLASRGRAPASTSEIDKHIKRLKIIIEREAGGQKLSMGAAKERAAE